MSFRENLRRGRSHLIIIAVLIVGGAIVIGIEDEDLTANSGTAPDRSLPAERDATSD